MTLSELFVELRDPSNTRWRKARQPIIK